MNWDEVSSTLPALAPGETDAVLLNSTGVPVDPERLAERIAATAGAEAVTSLQVHVTSQARNLRFLRALPALQVLHLEGLRLETLEGIDAFRSGRFLRVATGKNRRRALDALTSLSLDTLQLTWANSGDLRAVAQMRALRHLRLGECPPLEMSALASLGLESLQLFGGKVPVLADTSLAPSLRQLTLQGCRKLTRFEGDHGGITWMVVQQCPALDWSTVATFRGLQYLTLVSAKGVRLSHFAALPTLKGLSLRSCTLTPESDSVEHLPPSLEKLLVTSLKDDAAKAWSRLRPRVKVSNGQRTFVDGELDASV